MSMDDEILKEKIRGIWFREEWVVSRSFGEHPDEYKRLKGKNTQTLSALKEGLYNDDIPFKNSFYWQKGVIWGCREVDFGMDGGTHVTRYLTITEQGNVRVDVFPVGEKSRVSIHVIKDGKEMYAFSLDKNADRCPIGLAGKVLRTLPDSVIGGFERLYKE